MCNLTRDMLKPETVYIVDGESLYFYSPDGTGGYWYESMAEVIDNHGPVDAVVFIRHEENS